MIFYSLLLLSSMTLVCFSKFIEKRLGVYLCVVVFIILGAIASLRGYVGTDTYSYHIQFEQINTQENYDAMTFLNEPAFVAIAEFVKFTGGNSFAYVSFIGILQTLLVIFILRKIERPALFLMFYIATFYLEFHFNIIRESTSTLLILISLLGIREGGPKFFIPLLSSILFHYTAIFVVAYVLIYKQFLENKYIYAALLLLLLSAVIYEVVTVFYDLLYIKYKFYLEEDMGVEQKLGIGVLLKLCLYIGLAITLLKRSPLDIIFFVLPLVLIKLLMVNYPIVGRAESFILPILILILTKDAEKGWRRELSRVCFVALSILNVYGVIYTISNENLQPLDFEHSMSPYIPYHTLLEVK